MEVNASHLQQYNLTGQVSIVDYIAKFTGNYSSVYLGNWNGSFVAIKVIKASPGQQDHVLKRKVLREVTCWASTSHQNIYPFYGFANDQAFGQYGALISPWCANGDADRYLSEKGEKMIMADRTNLWKGVVEGIVYLHNRRPPIVHGDLKPGNVLIDEFGKPRICDFGLAQIFFDDDGTGMTTTSEHTGTARYLAPELVASDTTVYPTLSSDVYALGCLGLEFIYSQKPFSNHTNNLRGQIFIAQRRGLPPATAAPYQNWASQRIWPLITTCWRLDPRFRPSAFNIDRMLGRATLTLPPTVLQRVIYYVDVLFSKKGDPFDLTWKRRVTCLRNLSLVSKACWTMANPSLYREIRLAMYPADNSHRALIRTLSRRESLVFNLMPDGYGAHTETLIICTTFNPIISEEFLTILDAMRRLQVVVICTRLFVYRRPPTHPLTILEIQDIDISWFLAESTVIRALSCLQRLRVYDCHRGPERTPLSGVLLPNLQEIDIEIPFNWSATNPLLDVLSNWLMPSLCHFHAQSSFSLQEYPTYLSKFLQAHGTLLRHLHVDLVDTTRITDIIPLCPNLRSLTIADSFFSPDSLHPHSALEEIVIKQYAATSIEGYLGAVELFKLAAQTRFPKLMHFKLYILTRTSLVSTEAPLVASFRAGDEFITVEEPSQAPYRWYDGGRIVYGAQ